MTRIKVRKTSPEPAPPTISAAPQSAQPGKAAADVGKGAQETERTLSVRFRDAVQVPGKTPKVSWEGPRKLTTIEDEGLVIDWEPKVKVYVPFSNIVAMILVE